MAPGSHQLLVRQMTETDAKNSSICVPLKCQLVCLGVVHDGLMRRTNSQHSGWLAAVYTNGSMSNRHWSIQGIYDAKTCPYNLDRNDFVSGRETKCNLLDIGSLNGSVLTQ